MDPLSLSSPTRVTRDEPSNTKDTSFAATCVTGHPDQYGHVEPDACNSYYAFYPNFEANLAFAVLFGLTSVAHIVQGVVYKKVCTGKGTSGSGRYTEELTISPRNSPGSS